MDAQYRVSMIGRLLFEGVDLEIDVVDAHHFSSVDVDYLLVEQVAFQKKQASRAVNCRPIGCRGTRLDAAVNGRDCRKRKNAVPGLGFHDEGRDAGAVL